MLFVFKYKSLPIGLNITGFQDLIPDFATLSFLNATGPRPSPTEFCLVCRQREEQVGDADARVHRIGIERLCQLRDWVRTTKTQ